MNNSTIWRALTDTVYCFTLVPYILNHKYRTRKYAEAVDEKFGLIPTRSKKKECLLIHAVSVGEVIAAEPIIHEFSESYPDWDIHISVSTATGREVAIKRYPTIPVSFYPLDLSLWVKRFFSRIRPSAILLMELEIWPNFLSLAKDYAIPVLVVNGRITEKSAGKYIKYKSCPILKQMLRVPELWLAQNQTYAERFKAIGVAEAKILTLGSVKYDTIPTEPNNELSKKYREILGFMDSDTVIVAGSTHDPEEKIILDSYKSLKMHHPEIKLVLVPRHPHRFNAVYAEAQEYGSCTKYSAIESATATASISRSDIVIVDKMGILSEIYHAADIVFIGGSLINHGGQNMLETCGIGKPTIIGYSYYNFSDAVDVLVGANGIKIAKDSKQLTLLLQDFIANPAKAAAIGQAGRDALLAHKGCSRRTIDILSRIIRKKK